MPNGDMNIEMLAERIVALETQRSKKRDLIHTFLGAGLTAGIIIATVLIDIGGSRESLKVVQSVVHQHVDIDTPQRTERLVELERTTGIHSSRILTLDERLNRIENKIDQLLMRKQVP